MKSIDDFATCKYCGKLCNIERQTRYRDKFPHCPDNDKCKRKAKQDILKWRYLNEEECKEKCIEKSKKYYHKNKLDSWKLLDVWAKTRYFRNKLKDMRLWLLRPVEGLSKDDNPWDPWYDKAFGFVVRAETKEEARRFASDDAGDEENHDWETDEVTGETVRVLTLDPWVDEKYSTCIELANDGDKGVIIKDFASA